MIRNPLDGRQGLAIADGHTATHPSVFTPAEWQAVCRSLNLTDRQCQIMSGVLQGRKARQVAGELGICQDTVRAHLRQIYHKLKVKDRMELLARCVQEFRGLYFPKIRSPDG